MRSFRIPTMSKAHGAWNADRSRVGWAISPDENLVVGRAECTAVPRLDCRRGTSLFDDCPWRPGILASDPCALGLCGACCVGELDVSAHHRLLATRCPRQHRTKPDSTVSRNRRCTAVPAASLPPGTPPVPGCAPSALAEIGRSLGPAFRQRRRAADCALILNVTTRR